MTTEPVSGLPKALVVDDHTISRAHITAALEQMPCEVRQAGTAAKAISTALNWHPDILCTDICLPDANGLDVISEIRSKWPKDKAQPEVLILTADPGVTENQDLVALQIIRILIKPISGTQLREAIGHIIHRQVSEPETSSLDPELKKLFRKELQTRLPELDSSMLAFDMNKAVTVLHQLIASAAICHETALESNLRALDRACRQPISITDLGDCYTALLRTVRDFQSREGVMQTG